LDLENINKTARFILRRLYNDERFGGRHTAEVHLKKGIPPEYQRYTDKAIKLLYSKGLLVKKPTCYGTEVYLNPNKLAEIEDMLGIERD
jgi:hypothetical protein